MSCYKISNEDSRETVKSSCSMKWERGKESAAVSSAGNRHGRWESLCLHPDRADKGMRETPLCLRMLHTSQSEYANAHGFLGSHMHLCLYLELGKMLPRSWVKKLKCTEFNLACSLP